MDRNGEGGIGEIAGMADKLNREDRGSKSKASSRNRVRVKTPEVQGGTGTEANLQIYRSYSAPSM